MRAARRAFPVVILLLVGGSLVRADDLLAPDRPIEGVIDHYLDAKLGEAGVQPAPETDPANLIRRLTLDLVGRIPTAAESRAYVESTDPEKRTKLVDRLMTSPGFVRHQADAFDAMMMAGSRGSLREYLMRALKDNRPWDQIFREVVVADEAEEARKGASEFLKPRLKDLDRLTNDVSTTFFGVNVSCAKCHDHPRVKDWKQDHFFGMKAFFGRTFENGGFVAEREYGLVKFKPTAGAEKAAKFMFLTGRVLEAPEAKEPTNDEQKEEKKRLDEFKKKKVAPPPAAYSVRAKLVELALEPGERDFFARSIVNRLWHRLSGYGLVMPIDQMHSQNPPSHPEMLEWLARDTTEHRYDLRRLIRGMVLTRAYARSSQWTSGKPPKPQLFAVAAIRPLTPKQLATSMWVAAADPVALTAIPTPEELDKRIEGMEDRARELAGSIARPGEEYSIGVSEALLMSNSDRLKDLLADGDDRLIHRMAQLKDRSEQVDAAVRNTLSRPPADDEVSLLGDYLGKREDRLVEGCRQLIWALMTSAEFRFNY